MSLARHISVGKVARLWIFACAALALASAATAQQAPRAGAAEKLTLEGVGNFARIDGFVYRGAQPKSYAFSELKNAGIGVVVDLRNEKGEIAKERDEVQALGMRFVSIPWKGTGEPSREEVISFLSLLHEANGEKIFVHCRRGADRTGVMIALYRITFDGWTTEQAVQEMHEFHYAGLFLPNLARFVRAYPNEVASDPRLKSLTVAAAAIPQD